MQTSNYGDVTSIRIELNELKARFDKSMRDGENFDNVKAIHLQIKELECYLNALEWHPNSFADMKNPGTVPRGDNQNRYRHIKEPPPLL